MYIIPGKLLMKKCVLNSSTTPPSPTPAVPQSRNTYTLDCTNKFTHHRHRRTYSHTHTQTHRHRHTHTHTHTDTHTHTHTHTHARARARITHTHTHTHTVSDYFSTADQDLPQCAPEVRIAKHVHNRSANV